MPRADSSRGSSGSDGSTPPLMPRADSSRGSSGSDASLGDGSICYENCWGVPTRDQSVYGPYYPLPMEIPIDYSLLPDPITKLVIERKTWPLPQWVSLDSAVKAATLDSRLAKTFIETLTGNGQPIPAELLKMTFDLNDISIVDVILHLMANTPNNALPGCITRTSDDSSHGSDPSGCVGGSDVSNSGRSRGFFPSGFQRPLNCYESDSGSSGSSVPDLIGGPFDDGLGSEHGLVSALIKRTSDDSIYGGTIPTIQVLTGGIIPATNIFRGTIFTGQSNVDRIVDSGIIPTTINVSGTTVLSAGPMDVARMRGGGQSDGSHSDAKTDFMTGLMDVERMRGGGQSDDASSDGHSARNDGVIVLPPGRTLQRKRAEREKQAKANGSSSSSSSDSSNASPIKLKLDANSLRRKTLEKSRMNANSSSSSSSSSTSGTSTASPAPPPSAHTKTRKYSKGRTSAATIDSPLSLSSSSPHKPGESIVLRWPCLFRKLN